MIASKDIQIGALMRAYSTTPKSVTTMVDSITITIENLQKVGINDAQIGVWADQNNPAADCGETHDAMCAKLASHPGAHIHKTTNGDLFVSTLNEGIQEQADRGLTHSLILSWEAVSYVDASLINSIKQAVSRGALAVGVALPEIAEFVCKGAIMNTLALWDIEALLKVGGFDPHDTKPRYADHYAGSNAGVGEFIPLIKLAECHHRPILAVIKPTSQQEMIQVPEDRRELQRKKLESKQRRIDGMLREIGKTPEDLLATIIPGYPC